MTIKHVGIEISEKNPFEHCKLERKQYAQVLSQIVELYSDGFVLSINNEWGSGKTTFVKMWQQYLKTKGFNTIYFNAWENDFDSNPLVAIMSELKILTTNENKDLYKSIVAKGATITKNVLPALLKAVAEKYIDTKLLVEAIENTTKGATEILENEIKDYAKKKESIIEFREKLEKFIAETENPHPLVFIIDELDRCRPDYAVEILEQMKHFFCVPGIVFVLSIDKSHLAASVKGFYGSESINTDEYLRRFIDLEYSIPQPSNKVFCKYLYTYYSFNDFFSSQERIKYRDFYQDGEQFIKTAEILFSNINATLRQQEKIFGQIRLILKLFPPNSYTFPHLLFFLVFTKILNAALYKKIETYSFSLQELSDAFSDAMPKDIRHFHGVNLIYVQALLLHFYNNSRSIEKQEQFYKDVHGKPEIIVTSKLELGITRTNLDSCLRDIHSHRDYSDTTLTYLLTKINLTEGIV